MDWTFVIVGLKLFSTKICFSNLFCLTTDHFNPVNKSLYVSQTLNQLISSQSQTQFNGDSNGSIMYWLLKSFGILIQIQKYSHLVPMSLSVSDKQNSTSNNITVQNMLAIDIKLRFLLKCKVEVKSAKLTEIIEIIEIILWKCIAKTKCKVNKNKKSKSTKCKTSKWKWIT